MQNKPDTHHSRIDGRGLVVDAHAGDGAAQQLVRGAALRDLRPGPALAALLGRRQLRRRTQGCLIHRGRGALWSVHLLVANLHKCRRLQRRVLTTAKATP
jgi:hypothetical protein